jgi:Glycosyl hydrolase family 3 N terminal domain
MERGTIELSERYIRENCLPPWIAAFKAGTLGVMAGYPEIDGIPEHSSEKWNTQILRKELGFRGIVESEGNGFETLFYEQTMKLTPDDLMLLDEDMHWKVVPGIFDVMIGKSSADIVLTGPLEVESPQSSE